LLRQLLMRAVSGGSESALIRIPLFPLKTVLFPRGWLALRIFEQRYLTMAKSCLTAGTPFGVCLITRGEEVASPGTGSAPEFATVGTFARIRTWDMPQLGILQISAVGEARFAVRTHELMPDGLVVGNVAPLRPEPTVAMPAERRGLAELLERLAARIGPQHFPDDRAFDDASWVGSRLAEILPLPLPMKQALLEMKDADARLTALQRFIDERVAP
jgi:Lon protease-like protein